MALATTFTNPNAPSVAIPAALTNSSQTTLSYPGNIENAAYYTRLAFSKYTRNRPSDKAKDELRATIILPIPENFSDNQSINWNQEELGVWGGIADKAGEMMSSYQNGASPYDAVRQNISGADLSNPRVAGIMAMIMMPKSMRDSSAGALQALGSQTLGAVVNPHLTATFNGVPLRRHDLAWRFSPRDAKEASTLGKIINKIRSEILPSFNQSFSKFALDYPSTATVDFVNISTDYKTKIFKSSVVEFNTNLGPSGIAFYANGVPVEIEMRMALQETEIVTREDFPA